MNGTTPSTQPDGELDVRATIERVLGTRLRQAINDPSRHVMREANDSFGDVAARAAIAATILGLFENDLHLITGERLAELEHMARQVQPSPLREDPAVLTAEEFEDLKRRWHDAQIEAGEVAA